MIYIVDYCDVYLFEFYMNYSITKKYNLCIAQCHLSFSNVTNSLLLYRFMNHYEILRLVFLRITSWLKMLNYF